MIEIQSVKVLRRVHSFKRDIEDWAPISSCPFPRRRMYAPHRAPVCPTEHFSASSDLGFRASKTASRACGMRCSGVPPRGGVYAPHAAPHPVACNISTCAPQEMIPVFRGWENYFIKPKLAPDFGTIFGVAVVVGDVDVRGEVVGRRERCKKIQERLTG